MEAVLRCVTIQRAHFSAPVAQDMLLQLMLEVAMPVCIDDYVTII